MAPATYLSSWQVDSGERPWRMLSGITRVAHDRPKVAATVICTGKVLLVGPLARVEDRDPPQSDCRHGTR